MKKARTKFPTTIAMLLAAALAAAQQPQTPAPTPSAPAPGAASSAASAQEEDKASPKTVTNKQRRQATKLFLQASKLFEQQEYDEALRLYQEAADLDPEN